MLIASFGTLFGRDLKPSAARVWGQEKKPLHALLEFKVKFFVLVMRLSLKVLSFIFCFVYSIIGMGLLFIQYTSPLQTMAGVEDSSRRTQHKMDYTNVRTKFQPRLQRVVPDQQKRQISVTSYEISADQSTKFTKNRQL